MKVRVWNAYASNNSGSYTIVGVLPSEEVAREVADELAALCAAHTAWSDARTPEDDGEASPLAAFCKRHGLQWEKGRGLWDDWPQYGHADNRPRVLAVGHQVIVHHDYTISLPPTFGEFFYKRGGRVEHEDDHAHHPIVAVAAFWWGAIAEATRDEARGRLIAALTAADGPLAVCRPDGPQPAWRCGDGFHSAPLTVGAVFPDVVAGVTALQAAGEAHGAKMHVRLFEMPDDRSDPLAYLRATDG